VYIFSPDWVSYLRTFEQATRPADDDATELTKGLQGLTQPIERDEVKSKSRGNLNFDFLDLTCKNAFLFGSYKP
jgi:hypothetical protein